MWIQTDEHIIDFMAPIYAESFSIAQPGVIIPRKMFQKRREEDKQILAELQAVGDYIVFPDPDLSEQMIDHFLSPSVYTDLLYVADVWFGNRRHLQKPGICVSGSDGIDRYLKLPVTTARSSW